MIVQVWRIAAAAAAGVFVLLFVLLLALRLLRNKYYHNYHEDELIKTERKDNSRNSIYFTHGESNKYIKKYVICKTVYDKFLVCNFTGKCRYIVYFVVQYNRRRKPISVLRIEETVKGDASKVISLSKKCAFVNVEVSVADDKTINTDVIRPLSIPKIRLQSFLKSFAMFCFLFAARHAAIELLLKSTMMRPFLCNWINYVAVGVCLVFAILSYFISVACFRGKNSKRLSGGNLEYDFL